MKSFEILLILNLIFFVGLSFYSIFMINQESVKCIASPLNYGVERYQHISNSSVYCKCYFDDPRYLPILVTYNSTNPIDIPQVNIYKPLNLSNINFNKN